MYVSIEKILTSFIGTQQAVEREDVETEQVPVNKFKQNVLKLQNSTKQGGQNIKFFNQ